MAFSDPFSEIVIAGIGPIRVLPQFGGYSSENDRRNPGIALFLEKAQAARCIFDVGAHVGLYTLPAAHLVSEHTKIFAFEASPVNAAILAQHLQLNGCERVRVVEQVIGEEGRQSTFSLVSNGFGDLNTLAVAPGVAARFSSEASAVTEHSLDIFVESETVSPDLLKIDVEGAELRVLRGARRLLERHRPVVFLSVHPEEIGLLGGSLNELADLVRDLQYDLREISQNPGVSLQFGEYVLTPK